MDAPPGRRPTYHRPVDGESTEPLLYPAGRSTTRPSSPAPPVATAAAGAAAGVAAAAAPLAAPPLSRLSSRISRMRSRAPPASVAAETRRRYAYAAVFLALSLVAFTVQTELSAHIQRDLGWDKAYCMMYLTHGSWTLLWPLQLGLLRLRRRDVPWPVFWRRHAQLIRSTALMTQARRLDVARAAATVARAAGPGPAAYLARTVVMIALALTVAGLSWYVAVDMTSPADLTAIYNCSAFFAYAFSVPLLRERVRPAKVAAVMIAVVGVMVVAYGDTETETESEPGAGAGPGAAPGRRRRFLGNMVIGVGSVLYGLYEVLYKRYACPPSGVSPTRGMIFAVTVASAIGLFTLLVLWIPLPILHLTGAEPFRLPTGRTAALVLAAVLSNAVFSGSFLVLISLTSPVLSGVASLLTIFLVALADWWIRRKAMSGAAVAGGALIVVAFVILCRSSYREMVEHDGGGEGGLREGGGSSSEDDEERGGGEEEDSDDA